MKVKTMVDGIATAVLHLVGLICGIWALAADFDGVFAAFATYLLVASLIKGGLAVFALVATLLAKDGK